MINARFWYMKLLGFFTAIIGFSYSLTSFYNLFSNIFDSKIVNNDINIWISSIGLLFPLFVFILGVFFYFYADVLLTVRNRAIFVCIIVNIIINIICLISVLFDINLLNHLMEFVHFSLGYILLLLNVFFVYGKYKYKY